MERVQQSIGDLRPYTKTIAQAGDKLAPYTSLTIIFYTMLFCDFKLLDLPMQAHTICQRGVYLSERAQDDFFIALYRVHDFYVEVYYNFADNEIVKLISFHNDAFLEPYLNKINIDGIVPSCQ